MISFTTTVRALSVGIFLFALATQSAFAQCGTTADCSNTTVCLRDFFGGGTCTSLACNANSQCPAARPSCIVHECVTTAAPRSRPSPGIPLAGDGEAFR